MAGARSRESKVGQRFGISKAAIMQIRIPLNKISFFGRPGVKSRESMTLGHESMEAYGVELRLQTNA